MEKMFKCASFFSFFLFPFVKLYLTLASVSSRPIINTSYDVRLLLSRSVVIFEKGKNALLSLLKY